MCNKTVRRIFLDRDLKSRMNIFWTFIRLLFKFQVYLIFASEIWLHSLEVIWNWNLFFFQALLTCWGQIARRCTRNILNNRYDVFRCAALAHSGRNGTGVAPPMCGRGWRKGMCGRGLIANTIIAVKISHAPDRHININFTLTRYLVVCTVYSM